MPKPIGKRLPALHFIPQAIPLSEMEEWQADEALGVEDDRSGMWVEKLLLQMLYDLENDKQRVVLLCSVLRECGYNLDHKSLAKALHVNNRWYMRIKESITKTLKKYNAI